MNILAVYGVGMVIQSVEKELYELEYSLSKEEIRRHGSNVFILMENVVKELVYIYGYLLYGDNYKGILSKYGKIDKLMFGKAIDILNRINNDDTYTKKELIIKLNRNYLVFDSKSKLFDDLLICSKIRGKILHEHGLDIKRIEEYKYEVKNGVNIAFKVLKKLKEKSIFPTIVEFDSVVYFNEGNTVYFKDEIGSRIPINIEYSDINELKNKQWYIFRNSNIEKLIPVVNKIDAFVNDTIEPNIVDINIALEDSKKNLGYLKIIGESNLIPINSKKISIGRLSTNNIQLTNRSISRKHCLIENIDKYIYLIDLGSKFGTYLNGRKLIEGERVMLATGDIISVGVGNEVIKLIYKVGEQ